MIPLLVTPDLRQACPAHFPGDFSAVLPHTVLGDTNGGWSAAYRCPCGEEWSNSWSADDPWPLRTEPVPLAELIRLAPLGGAA